MRGVEVCIGPSLRNAKASSFKLTVTDNQPQPNELSGLHAQNVSICLAAGRLRSKLHMLHALLTALFGCTHGKTTFPLTPGSTIDSPRRGSGLNGPYVVCLDCGKEFRYNWSEMRIGETLKVARQPVVSEREVGVSLS
jgi:hypothetical protein